MRILPCRIARKTTRSGWMAVTHRMCFTMWRHQRSSRYITTQSRKSDHLLTHQPNGDWRRRLRLLLLLLTWMKPEALAAATTGSPLPSLHYPLDHLQVTLAMYMSSTSRKSARRRRLDRPMQQMARPTFPARRMRSSMHSVPLPVLRALAQAVLSEFRLNRFQLSLGSSHPDPKVMAKRSHVDLLNARPALPPSSRSRSRRLSTTVLAMLMTASFRLVRSQQVGSSREHRDVTVTENGSGDSSAAASSYSSAGGRPSSTCGISSHPHTCICADSRRSIERSV